MDAAPRPDAATLRLTPAELTAFLAGAFPPEARASLGEVVSLAPGHARLALRTAAAHLRPGGIVSGPTLMGLVDVAAYAVVLAHVGPVGMAVTNALTIHFLRACPPGAVIADARLLRLGRRLAAIDVRLWTESEERLVAQSTVSYSLPA